MALKMLPLTHMSFKPSNWSDCSSSVSGQSCDSLGNVVCMGDFGDDTSSNSTPRLSQYTASPRSVSQASSTQRVVVQNTFISVVEEQPKLRRCNSLGALGYPTNSCYSATAGPAIATGPFTMSPASHGYTDKKKDAPSAPRLGSGKFASAPIARSMVQSTTAARQNDAKQSGPIAKKSEGEHLSTLSVGSEVLPSVGSKLHATGRCKPCMFQFTARGCVNGEQCGFCHNISHNCRRGPKRPCKAVRTQCKEIAAMLSAMPTQCPETLEKLAVMSPYMQQILKSKKFEENTAQPLENAAFATQAVMQPENLIRMTL